MAQIAQAGPAPCAFACGMFRAEAEEASTPGFDSDVCQINVAGGLVGEVTKARTRNAEAVVADATFATLVQACSSCQPIAPRFDVDGTRADQQRVQDPPILPSGKCRPCQDDPKSSTSVSELWSLQACVATS